MPRLNHRKKRALSLLATASALLMFVCGSLLTTAAAAPLPGDVEYFGKLDPELSPNTEDMDQVVFKPFVELSKIKFQTPLESGVTVTAGRLYNPLLDKSVILTLLVEPKDDSEPYLYADLDQDRMMTDNERFALKRSEDNPLIFEATIKLPLKNALFQNYPVFVQFFKSVRWDDMSEDQRMVMQSKDAFARGYVDIAGRKTLVEYGFDQKAQKISVSNGFFGVDADGDGKILMGRFSPESTEAKEETVVFRVGENYVSTRRIDLEKNQIIMRSHPASDYKRIEVTLGSELPDFTYTDFNGKKHKLSELRGKYVLVDFWGLWCPACRDELPYQKAAYSRFQARGFEILGMNTDEDPSQIKDVLKKNGMNWAQATLSSIKDVALRYRINRFPTSLLIGPDGKVIVLDQDKLRGRDLLKTLDKILPT
jgi:thiol-disulfide isomerase/thioredoxin